jgi:hypothetical protein
MNFKSDATDRREDGGQEPLKRAFEPAAPGSYAAPKESGANLPDDFKSGDGRSLMARLRALASQI